MNSGLAVCVSALPFDCAQGKLLRVTKAGGIMLADFLKVCVSEILRFALDDKGKKRYDWQAG